MKEYVEMSIRLRNGGTAKGRIEGSMEDVRKIRDIIEESFSDLSKDEFLSFGDMSFSKLEVAEYDFKHRIVDPEFI